MQRVLSVRADRWHVGCFVIKSMNTNEIRIETPRQKRMRSLVSGVVIAGALACAFAIALPKNEARIISEPVHMDTVPSASEAPQPIEAPQAKVEEQKQEETKIESERPQVALATEETEDFMAVARLATDQGDLKLAFDALRKHIYKTEPTAEVLLNIGRFGRQLGEHAVAEQALLDAAQLDPTSSDTQTELARVLLEVGELEEARLHARQAIRLNADDSQAWNVAGRVAMKQSEWARAEGAFRRALELDPMSSMIHNNMGLLYVYTARAPDAIDSLETAVELFGENVPYFVYNNLGLAHEMAGNYEEARDAFSEAVAVNPTYARGSVNLKRVMSTIAMLEEKAAYQTANVDTTEGDSL